mgnify:CR=1 FL=1
MKTLYLDCGMGAAGDMLTAALSRLLRHGNIRSPTRGDDDFPDPGRLRHFTDNADPRLLIVGQFAVFCHFLHKGIEAVLQGGSVGYGGEGMSDYRKILEQVRDGASFPAPKITSGAPCLTPL